MAWTAPRTWVVAEIVTAAQLNTHLRDDLRYLKGLDGVPTIQNGLIIDNTLGTEYLQIPSLTTTQRDALTPVNGMAIYNSTLTVFQRYEAGAWVSYTDIAKMVIASQAQGDVFYASSATAIARLGAGTAGQFLKTQGAAANPIWANQLVDFQRFTANGTWTKPAGAKVVMVECIGAGGGGGGGIGALGGNLRAGGGGGGGGARTFRIMDAASCGATEAVTVPTGGAGGAANADGVAGGTVTFGSHLSAFGGGFGNGDATTGQVNGGGGGAGAYAVGANGGVATGGAGGGPGGAAAGASVDGFGGGGGGNVAVGGASVYGGGGGGSPNANATPVYAGGCSVHAGGGGGSGGGCFSDDSELAGAAGGGVPGATSGGGGAGGAVNGGAGAAGTASGEYAGSGGGGGGGQDSGTGGVGGAGGAPGGGGGGGGGGTSTGGAGGAGGRGEVRVWAG